jgi:hypothetical protein
MSMVADLRDERRLRHRAAHSDPEHSEREGAKDISRKGAKDISREGAKATSREGAKDT